MIKIFIGYLFLFAFIEWLYLILAQKKGILDRVTERSSHSIVPIRGAGIIFPLAFIAPFFYEKAYEANFALLVGLVLISIISFFDDIQSVMVKWRILFHFTAVSLVLWQIGLYNTNVVYVIAAFVFMVGIINAYNFMDGINGITAIYSLIAVSTLFYISQNKIYIIDRNVFISLIASLFVFSFLNVRRVTKCFSGDVGSISMAFILTFLILKLIFETGNYLWVLLLAVYGIDTLATIIIRTIRKENILEAHRSHFYQYLANEYKMSHIKVAVLYGVIQLFLNIILITQKPFVILLVLITLICLYAVARLSMEGAKRLFVKY